MRRWGAAVVMLVLGIAGMAGCLVFDLSGWWLIPSFLLLLLGLMPFDAARIHLLARTHGGHGPAGERRTVQADQGASDKREDWG